MKKSSWVIIAVICILAGFLLYLKLTSTVGPSDEEQIHILLSKAESAVERKDLRGAMSCVSKDYSDSVGNNYARLRLHVIRAFRNPEIYSVTLENTSIRVYEISAEVQVDVSATAVYAGVEQQVFNAPAMKIGLIKEKIRRWLVIPADEWKIASMSNLPDSGWE